MCDASDVRSVVLSWGSLDGVMVNVVTSRTDTLSEASEVKSVVLLCRSE